MATFEPPSAINKQGTMSVQSNLHITTLDYMITSTIWHIFSQPNFLVLIYLHTTTTAFVIQHF
jgi:hypothetical protein